MAAATAASWDEIKTLAKDLQRIQLLGTAQKLSERNCIEIVQRLTELRLIDVNYTTDGKAYITPAELGKEIREELIVKEGRVDLAYLQQVLSVDYSLIEAKVNELVKNDRNLTLVLGQLIDRSYIDRLAEEINDKLQEQGQVTVAELAKSYNLPGDFIQEIIQSHIGRSVHAVKDERDRNVFYTETFVARHLAKIRGAFSAVTRPTPVHGVIVRHGLQEHLFFTILESLISDGRLPGVISGGRQDKATYIPNCYTRAQNDWVDSFYKQNGYLEYDALTRLGIADSRSFIKKRLRSEHIEYLESCCIGQLIKDRIESEIDEALATGTWVDILPILPSICSPSDAHQLVQSAVNHKPNVVIYGDSIVSSAEFLARFQQSFDTLLKAKAEKTVRENPSILLSNDTNGRQAQNARGAGMDESAKDDRKNQNTRKTGGKTGFGTMGGRESKTKSTKKKSVGYGKDRGGNDDSSDDDSSSTKRQAVMEFLSETEIAEELRKSSEIKDCPPEFIDAIAAKLYRPLTRQYGEELKSVFLQTMQPTSNGAEVSSAAAKNKNKKDRADLLEKLNGMSANARLFERGIKLFEDELQVALSRHLLKTVCTEITNIVFCVCASDRHLTLADDSSEDTREISDEMRTKLISMLPANDRMKPLLVKLNSTLNGKLVADFLTQLDIVSVPGGIAEIGLKKPDKKKERQLIFNHRQSLAEQLRVETDPAMALHLAAVLLVQGVSQCMVHAPGRCVPQIISYLSSHIPIDQHHVLVQCQDLVMQQLKVKSTTGGEPVDVTTGQGDAPALDSNDVSSRLSELLIKVKEIAFATRKAASALATDEI